MKNTRAALRYAKALLSLTLEQKQEIAVAENMQEVTALFESNELSDFLDNPVLANSVKQATLQKLLPSLHASSQQLIELLSKNNRINLLEEVAKAYLELLKQHEGKQTAVVTTAVALTPELEKLALDKAMQLSSSKITLENRIDPSIVGGFILHIGDLQYNASVAYQLEQMKRDFTQTNYSA